MRNLSTDASDLRALLEKLYPDIYIANSGVALLAAQIAQLENRCHLMRDQNYFWRDSDGEAVVGTDFLSPVTAYRQPEQEPNNYTE
jgi:outer membrane murein-binding lipoprotein Lpp